MSIIRKLAGETAIYGISSVLGRFLSILLTPIHTNLLRGTADFGLLSVFFSYIAFINVFLIFGMETTFFRFTEDEKKKDDVYNQAFLFVSLLALSVLSIGLIFPAGISALIGYPGQETVIMLVAGIIAADALAALPMARLRREGKAKRFAGITIANIVLTVGLNTVFLMFISKDIEYVFAANLIGSLARLGLAMIGGVPSSLKLKPSVLKPLLHYGFFIMIAGLAGMMNETLDRILIPQLWEDGTLFQGKARSGEQINGIYAACYKLSMFIALFTQAFRYAAEPFFFKTASDKDSPETFAKVFHYFFLAVLIAFLIVSAFSHEIASFNFFGLFGEENTFINERYWEGLQVIPILLLAYVCSAAYVNMSIWFKITKQTRFAILFTGIGALITIIINVVTIPKYGFIGSAWATLASYATMLVLVYLIGQHYYPIPYRIKRLGTYLALMLAAFWLNHTIGPTNGFILAFISKILVCAAALGLVFVAEKWMPVFEK